MMDLFSKHGRATPKSPVEPKAVSVPEAALLLGISEKAAYAAAKAGELPTLKFGQTVIVPLLALDEYMRSAYKPKNNSAK